jgi:uncharacterized NAD(P)/FAD-binding protein YdhS
MSLWADEPAHFAQWLARQPEAAAGLAKFATWATYGRYVTEELATALARLAPNDVRIIHYATSALAAGQLTSTRQPCWNCASKQRT